MPVSILMVVDFPAPFGPDVADHLAGVDGEGEVVDRDHLLADPAAPALGLSAYVEGALEVAHVDQWPGGVVCGHHQLPVEV